MRGTTALSLKLTKSFGTTMTSLVKRYYQRVLPAARHRPEDALRRLRNSRSAFHTAPRAFFQLHGPPPLSITSPYVLFKTGTRDGDARILVHSRFPVLNSGSVFPDAPTDRIVTLTTLIPCTRIREMITFWDVR
jgi:hypothetical protein